MRASPTRRIHLALQVRPACGSTAADAIASPDPRMVTCQRCKRHPVPPQVREQWETAREHRRALEGAGRARAELEALEAQLTSADRPGLAAVVEQAIRLLDYLELRL